MPTVRSHPPSGVQPTVAARACRRHWTRFASVGLIVWYQHWAHALSSFQCQCSAAQTNPQLRDGNLSLHVSISDCRSFSLLLSSPRSHQSLETAIFTSSSSSPPPTGQRPRHTDPNRHQYTLQDNTPTRFPSNPPLNRVSRTRPSSRANSSAPKHNAITAAAAAAAVITFLVQPRHPSHNNNHHHAALLLAPSRAFQAQPHHLLWRMT